MLRIIQSILTQNFHFQDQFPHGPRHFEEDLISIGAPRSISDNVPNESTFDTSKQSPDVSKVRRKRRSVSILDRHARSADVGVSGIYEVISEADLAFSPDNRIEAVTVFQGKIREEVVYGICMPVPGFSVLFVMVAVSAVVSALVAGSLLYRYQLQREHMAEQAQQNGAIQMNSFVNWMRFLKYKHNPTTITESNGSADGTVLRNTTGAGGKTEDTVQNRD